MADIGYKFQNTPKDKKQRE
ncbi:uncharacterized protein G2W53_043240 [Senna tora]|uniref:Uncharacterized protein n=1 Tax=Senna tora TaxID=362788 RepID=A0A834SIE8_9FABA|nr:uncharacterized protein G2W53_043240 [Senna tora]